MKITEKFDIDGFDIQPSEKVLSVFKNDSGEDAFVSTSDFDLRSSLVITFDGSGRAIEAGNDLYKNPENKIFGSPQLKVWIPKKGFCIFFSRSFDERLLKIHRTLMEGAMLYNATMSVIQEAYGKIDGNVLEIEYEDEISHDGEKWLFVGNSSTYFNGTPIKFKALCKAAGISIDVVYSTFGSAYLREFADENHERGQFLRNRLNEAKYAKVVLHDASGVKYEETKKHFDVIHALIEENGAETLLYMRYACAHDRVKRREEANSYREIYGSIASEYNLIAAPVVTAFENCEKAYPEINLYADDDSHHSKEGSYLIVCVWLKSFLGVSPLGNSYDAQLPIDVARKLQKIADEV